MEELMNLYEIENLERYEHVRIHHEIRTAQDALEISDSKFIKIFRVSKDLFRYLIGILEPFMRPKLRPRELDIETRVLIALNFYATGSYQRSVSLSKYVDVAQSTVSRCLKEVTAVLNLPAVLNEWVKFPNNFTDLNKVRRGFYEEHNFPGIVGCIDCTHIAIVAPGQQNPEFPEHLYVNRKGYHSINVQLVCDVKLRVLNVVARYPGSTNDAFIWNNSNLQNLLRNMHERGHKDYYLLGDSGYPLRTWLLTPLGYDPPPNSPESLYNRMHKQTRVKIECCNGVLKSRFRCLLKHRVLHYEPEMACKIINACVILHNMCIEYNIPEVDADERDDYEIDFGIYRNDPLEVNNEEDNVYRNVNIELADGRRVRNNVIRHLRR